MKALFLKDFYTLKESKLLILLMLAVAVIMTMLQGAESAGFVISYITVLSAVLVLNTLNYDELDNGYAFLLTMPVSRRQYVAEKYLFGLLTGIGGWLAAAVLAITMAGQPAADDDLWWMLYIGALLLMLVMQALMIPVQLKLGGQKGRVAILVLLAVIFGAAVAAVKNEKLGTSIWNGLTSLEPAEICLAGAAAALICLFISFLCSVRIMERKEF